MAIKDETTDAQLETKGIKSDFKNTKIQKDEEKDELAALDALEKEASEFNKARNHLILNHET